MTSSSDPRVNDLLEAWESVHKKGQVSLWLLLALYEAPKRMTDIKAYMEVMTQGTISSDDKSMYRALRRYVDVGLIEFDLRAGDQGPDIKVYRLTSMGTEVLVRFVQRNILPVFLGDKARHLFGALGAGDARWQKIN